MSGTSGFCSQNLTVSLITNNVINFTIRVNDTSNNFNRTSRILTVGDNTAPVFENVSTQSKTSFTSTEIINITANVTDGSVLNFVRCTTNRTDTHTNNSLTYLGNDLWSFSSTFAIADYNIPYCYAQDSSSNEKVEPTNLSFSVSSASVSSDAIAGGGGSLVIIEKQINTTPIISYGITAYSFFVLTTPSQSLKYLKFRNIGTGDFTGKVETIGIIAPFIQSSICNIDLTSCETEKILIKSGQTGFLLLNGSFTNELGSGKAGIVRLEGNKVFDLNIVIDRPPLYDLIIVKFIDLGMPQALAILVSYTIVIGGLILVVIIVRGIYA